MKKLNLGSTVGIRVSRSAFAGMVCVPSFQSSACPSMTCNSFGFNSRNFGLVITRGNSIF